MSAMSSISAAVVQLLDSCTDDEELVRTSALASLRAIARGAHGSYARNTMRATLAYLRANEAGGGRGGSGGGGGGPSSSSSASGATAKPASRKARVRMRVQISRAVLAVAEAGHAQFDAELAHEITRVCCGELEVASAASGDEQHQGAARELVAAQTLVALSPSHMSILVDEILSRMKAGAIPNTSLVFALERLAAGLPDAFAPCLSRILSRLLPMLGGMAVVWKLQVQVAAAFTAFCEALSQSDAFASGADSLPDDVRASILSAFDIFQSSESWLGSPKAAVRGATARALGGMANYVSTERICATSGTSTMAPQIISLLSRGSPNDPSREGLAQGLHGLLLHGGASVPPTDLSQILFQLQPLVAVPADYARPSFNRTRSELLRCVEALARANARSVVEHFVEALSSGASSSSGMVSASSSSSSSSSSSPNMQVGVAAVLTHVINHSKDHINQASIREIITSGILRVCNTNHLGVRAALSQIIVAMGTAGFLDDARGNRSSGGRELVLFVVRQCVYNDSDMVKWRAAQGKGWFSSGSENSVSPLQLSRAAERFVDGIGQCAQGAVWPTLFSTVPNAQYRGAMTAVCKCLVNIADHNVAEGSDVPPVPFDQDPDLPSSAEMFSRLMVAACCLDVQDHSPHVDKVSVTPALLEAGRAAKQLLQRVAPSLHPAVGKVFAKRGQGKGSVGANNTTAPDAATQETLLGVLCEHAVSIATHDTMWWSSVGNALCESLSNGAYDGCAALQASAYRILGVVVSQTRSSDLPRKWVDAMLLSVSHVDHEQCYGLARGLELAVTPSASISSASSGSLLAPHLDLVLQALAKVLRDECSVIKQGWFGSSKGDRTEAQVAATKGTLLLCWGHVCLGAPSDALQQRLDAQIVTNIMSVLADILHKKSGPSVGQLRDCFLHAITCVGNALDARRIQNSIYASQDIEFLPRDEVLGHICRWVDKMGAYSSESSLHVRVRGLNAIAALCSVAPALSINLQEHVLEIGLSTLSLPTAAGMGSSEFDRTCIKPVSNLVSVLLRLRGEEQMPAQLERFVFASEKSSDRSAQVGKLETHMSGEHVYQRLRALCVMSFLLRDFAVNTDAREAEDTQQRLEDTVFIRLFCCIMPRVMDTDSEVREAGLGLLRDTVAMARGKAALARIFGGEGTAPSTHSQKNKKGADVMRLLKGSSLEERGTAVRALAERFYTEVSVEEEEEEKEEKDHGGGSRTLASQTNVLACAKGLLPSLNDVDPGAAQAGAEAFLMLVDMRASGAVDMVSQLLVSASLDDAGESDIAGFGESKSGGKSKKEKKNTSGKTTKKGASSSETDEPPARPPLVAALQMMPAELYMRRVARTTVMFACRSLVHAHFEMSLNSLLASSLPLHDVILEIIVALAAPPATLRPMGSKQLPESATTSLLQRVVEHLMMTLNSSPPGTSSAPNGLLSAAHHALRAVLEAPSAAVTAFVDRYFTNLIGVVIMSISSLSCALQGGDSDGGASENASLFLRDAFATADALLRRAGCDDVCELLNGPDVHGLKRNKKGDFPQALAGIVARTCGGTRESKTKVIHMMEQYVTSGDPGQRRVSLAIVVELVSYVPHAAKKGKEKGANAEEFDGTMQTSIFDMLLGRAMDADAGVQSQALRGLGVATRTWSGQVFEGKAPAILNTVSGLLDAKTSIVADMALESLESIMVTIRLGLVEHILLNVCFRLQAALGSDATSTLCRGLKLLRRIASMGLSQGEEKRDLTMQLVEQMHRMLPAVLVQLRSEVFEVSVLLLCYRFCFFGGIFSLLFSDRKTHPTTPSRHNTLTHTHALHAKVRVAAVACFEEMSALLDSKSETSGGRISEVVAGSTVKGRRGKTIEDYETFLPALVEALMSSFSERAEAYIGSLQTMCQDAAPRVKADAALLLAQIVVGAPSHVSVRINTPGIVRNIAELCKHEQAMVRSRAVQSLSRFGRLE
jgi:hypothetical protein